MINIKEFKIRKPDSVKTTINNYTISTCYVPEGHWETAIKNNIDGEWKVIETYPNAKYAAKGHIAWCTEFLLALEVEDEYLL